MSIRELGRARNAVGLALAIGLGGAASSGASAADRSPSRPADQVWMAVSDQALDDLRGGFDLGGGLMVSFGITRAVYINGDLVTQTTFNADRLSGLTPVQAAQLGRQMQGLSLVQNGPGNSIDATAAAAGSGFGTVIQNTLDNQKIVNQTVINATTNAQSLIKGLNTQGTLNDSLFNAVRPR